MGVSERAGASKRTTFESRASRTCLPDQKYLQAHPLDCSRRWSFSRCRHRSAHHQDEFDCTGQQNCAPVAMAQEWIEHKEGERCKDRSAADMHPASPTISRANLPDKRAWTQNRPQVSCNNRAPTELFGLPPPPAIAARGLGLSAQGSLASSARSHCLTALAVVVRGLNAVLGVRGLNAVVLVVVRGLNAVVRGLNAKPVPHTCSTDSAMGVTLAGDAPGDIGVSC